MQQLHWLHWLHRERRGLPCVRRRERRCFLAWVVGEQCSVQCAYREPGLVWCVGNARMANRVYKELEQMERGGDSFVGVRVQE